MQRITSTHIIVLILALSACSSIPISTMMRFSGFDEQDFFTLDPKQLRVKTMINSSWAIDVEKSTRLSASLEGQKGLLNFTLPLVTVRVEKTPEKTGFFSNDPAYDVYYLKLTSQGVTNFQRFQQQAKTGGPQEVRLSAGIENSEASFNNVNEIIYLSIAIKLKEQDDFVLLIDKYNTNELK